VVDWGWELPFGGQNWDVYGYMAVGDEELMLVVDVVGPLASPRGL